MKIKRIAHLGIAVNDLETAIDFFTKGLPLEVTHREDYQGMKIGFVPVGDSSVELLQDVSGASAIRMAKASIILPSRWTIYTRLLPS
jgi:methylmalonyl-CoA/ethylmalonyl-CoA epimerase